METNSNKQQSATTGVSENFARCVMQLPRVPVPCWAQQHQNCFGPQYKTRKTSLHFDNLPDLLLDILWKQVAAVFIKTQHKAPQALKSVGTGWNFCAMWTRPRNRFVDGEPSVASVEGSSGCVKGSKRTEMDVSEHGGGIPLSSIYQLTYSISISIVCFI